MRSISSSLLKWNQKACEIVARKKQWLRKTPLLTCNKLSINVNRAAMYTEDRIHACKLYKLLL